MLLRQCVVWLTVAGYFAAVTIAPAWHDHGECCQAESPHRELERAGETPPHHCCASHHACPTARETVPADGNTEESPTHAPLHDDNCVVCQVLGQVSTPVQVVGLVATSVSAPEPVPSFVVAPLAIAISAYDSRGPPAARQPC